MERAAINRRQFLESGVMATALAAAGRLPLLGAPIPGGSGIDAPHAPYAVKPIRTYLKRFAPAGGGVRNREAYRLTYDIVHWSGANRLVAVPANPVIGQITIQRTAVPGGASYEIEQRTRIGGVDNVLEAQIGCVGETLRTWTVRTYHTQPRGGLAPLSTMVETGVNREGRIQIDAGSYRYGYTARHLVVTQWTVLDLLMRLGAPSLRTTVDVLGDLSLFKPDQELVHDGETSVTLQDGATVALKTYAQTGDGVLPIHYLIDGDGRPQLVTSCMVSWALTGVA